MFLVLNNKKYIFSLLFFIAVKMTKIIFFKTLLKRNMLVLTTNKVKIAEMRTNNQNKAFFWQHRQIAPKCSKHMYLLQ